MRSKFRNLKEFVRMNTRLSIAVVVALLGVIGLQTFLEATSTQCLGIADSKETTIAFETPVIVKRIFVIPGQMVKKGQPLIEVEPVEVNLKLMEVQTELDSLTSERKVRNALLGTFDRKIGGAEDPLGRQIEGLAKQVEELKRQQGLSVRYAEEDGAVATVAFRAREQVAPFLPIITLTPAAPNLVYGFVHESRISEFRLGDRVLIEPVSEPGRFAEGRVISLGSRIAPFPDRFQMGSVNRPTYFGRELVVSLPLKNPLLVGEKVKIIGESGSALKELGFQAFAESSSESASEKIGEELPFEAGGMVYVAESKSLLIVSDDAEQGKSPFWLLSLANPNSPMNVGVDGTLKIDDLESITRSGSGFLAMSSLSKNKKDQVLPERNLLVRFTLGARGVQIDRALDMRSPLIEALRGALFMRGISADLEELEVESFTLHDSDGYMALKKPQMPDGSSVIIRLPNLAARIEASRLQALDIEMYTMVKLETRECATPARVTDLVKTENGIYILSNCKKSEKTGQLWYLPNNAPAQQISQVTTFRRGRPEGLTFGADRAQIFVSSDNGGKKGSDILKMTLSETR